MKSGQIMVDMVTGLRKKVVTSWYQRYAWIALCCDGNVQIFCQECVCVTCWYLVNCCCFQTSIIFFYPRSSIHNGNFSKSVLRKYYIYRCPECLNQNLWIFSTVWRSFNYPWRNPNDEDHSPTLGQGERTVLMLLKSLRNCRH